MLGSPNQKLPALEPEDTDMRDPKLMQLAQQMYEEEQKKREQAALAMKPKVRRRPKSNPILPE